MRWFELTDARAGPCATEGCQERPTHLLLSDGIGSDYCDKCKAAIEAHYAIAELQKALDDLSHAADTAELLLRATHPGEAASLRGYVAAAIRVAKRSKRTE